MIDHEGLIKEARERLIKRASEIEAHVKKVPGWYPEAIQHAADIRLLLDALEARVLSPSEGDYGSVGPKEALHAAAEGECEAAEGGE